VNTLSRYYTNDDEGREVLRSMGHEPAKRGSSSDDWYRRMGYVLFKEEPRYKNMTADGKSVTYTAVFLRKELV